MTAKPSHQGRPVTREFRRPLERSILHAALLTLMPLLNTLSCASNDTAANGGGAPGTGGSGAICEAGSTRACLGPAACQGGQLCQNDSTWGPCDCGTGGAGTDGAAGASGSGSAAGSGGTSTSGGSGGSGGGTGGTAGGSDGGPCVPKTCLTIGVQQGGKACGIVSDGCGVNYIDCGACDTTNEPLLTCGGAPPKQDNSPGTGTPNICGGGCTELTINLGAGCTAVQTPKTYGCSGATSKPPKNGCVPSPAQGSIVPAQYWCCPP